MDRIEQRVTVKYFFLKGHTSKLIYEKLVNTLQDNAISLSAVKNWLRWFKSGSLSCDDDERLEKPLISLDRLFSSFWKVSLRECSSNGRAFLSRSDHHQKHSWSRTGLEKIHSQMCAPILSAEQKLRRATEFQSLLTILANLTEKNFQWIITGDAPWFAYLIESNAIFAFSHAEVTQRPDNQFRAKKLWLHLFHGKQPTDFGYSTERIQMQSGLFYW
jgi:hypothetical protein